MDAGPPQVDNPNMRVPTAVFAATGAFLAVAATGVPVVQHGREPDVVNLTAGLVLLVAGVQLMALNQTRLTGNLLVLASAVWFVPDLAPEVPWGGSVLAATSLVHVVPMVAAVLVAPQGVAVMRRGDRAVVFLAVVAAGSAVTGGYQLLVPALGLALLLAASGTMRERAAQGRSRAVVAHRAAVLATAAALTGIPIARATTGQGHEGYLFVGYAGLLAFAAVSLVRVGPWLGSIARLDVGPDALTTMDNLIAEATGDPRGHAIVMVRENRWVRLDGSPVMPPKRGSEPVLVVATHPVPTVLEPSVADGLRLAANNVIARELLRVKVHELAALRTRLVSVEEDERAALVARLRNDPLAALVQLRVTLIAHGAAADLVEHARDTERDIERVAAGLDPLDGVASGVHALRLLGQQLGASVEIEADDAPGIELDETTVRALWYACSEALTNAAKHAAGSRRRVTLAAEGAQTVLVVTDDGPGPGPSADVGLLGVRDRVMALGGTVVVMDARPGTRVEVRVPTTRQHLQEPGVSTDVSDLRSSVASMPPTTEVYS